MNSFLFFLSFILLNPRVLCFLSQFLIPGKVGGSGFFSFSCGFCKIKGAVTESPRKKIKKCDNFVRRKRIFLVSLNYAKSINSTRKL